MTTPIDPQMCLRTGRLLTEWFEHPEYTDEDLEKMACEAAGIDPKDRPRVALQDVEHPQYELAMKINTFISARKQRHWVRGMSKVEVAQRMDQATKMVNPNNFKFLDDATRQRTGLEINPLWMMECLVRSGLLSPKEQVAALKELASFTHSKAPSINHNTVTNMKPEDWLLELAKEEYQEVEIQQPKQPVEAGMGPRYETRLQKKAAEAQALTQHAEVEMEAMMAEVDAEWEDIEDDD